MKKVAGIVIAVLVVLGIAGFATMHAVDASGKRASAPPSSSASASSSAPVATQPAVTTKVATSMKTDYLTVDGLLRSYLVDAPVKDLPKSAPIIVMLAGIGSAPAGEITRDDLIPYVTANMAELVYPAGYGESWNAGGCCGAAASDNINDVAFLKALVAKVDPGHARSIYVVGYSNGARMAYRIACTDPSLFDGYAMVKGGPEPGCMVTKPVTLLQIASVNDPEIPYKPGDHGIEPTAMTTLAYEVRVADKCSIAHTVTHSGGMTQTTYSSCGDGVRFAFAVWQVGVHSFPRPPVSIPAASQVIWAFFSKTPIAPVPT
jgi:polyhydroxybutyrate depolymerase